ncbi:Spc24-domain-containing protein [Choiromyces venosus 120613-1]|uniref:Kinetochore protein Spc24 n=1 Tax=Choiromyces venosus 120613-1 TaxID=1336337 RepID=A0A3N4J889_9PEZI|nr:Spc24-domain-containing protein [Choiromyces venosus 120613-1]
MVLLDEAPEFLIHEVLSNFNISSDMHSLTRISETLARISTTRSKTLDDSRATLRALSRKMEISKQSMEATASSASRKEHGANMLRLDREKFALAKGINELESSAHGLEGQLARLKEELEQVDKEDPMQSAAVEAEDGTLLKLKVYRSLGIDLQEDGGGGYSKAVIRNSSKGDIHVVNIERKFSHFFYANYFWNVM